MQCESLHYWKFKVKGHYDSPCCQMPVFEDYTDLEKKNQSGTKASWGNIAWGLNIRTH